MDTKKLLMGTISGGIAYFFLGWIVYGILLMDTMAAYSNPAFMRAPEDMVWWAMIAGNLGYAAFLSYCFLRFGKVSTFGSGAMSGAVLAFLTGLSVDLMMYSTSTMMNDPTGIVIDVAASAFMGAIVGGIIGTVLGMGKTAATPS